ncbi:hypothetical protein NJI34_28550 [Pseudomonas sp. S 311-6]|uniref:hypothetical protein n=1 Tax=Pseudomonas TaxID=286 RepID=UPI002097C47C|nr:MULTISPECIES: hypothetical protein [Pseudomonas]MCO7640726.1 hypothetical protein [Pseudomonas sp. S 311-6]MCO7566420.1 hypothetical protein [Pseudomonas mosselii]MCO7595032.1 hypothetical protein [Pseudomonas guariconensis]MCO7617448.1 hypothetical protein [Pseudomonas guariconensis]MCU7221089.1 hypothetical protein [Pseudomonas brassicacearum]
MAETMICHGLEERFYRKLEEKAKEAGLTPEQYAVQIVRESLVEKTRPKGAGKIRHLPRP